MNSKKGYLLILIFVIIMVLSGCKEKEITDLTFRITWDAESGRGQAIERIITEFNEEHETINVTLIGGNEDKEETNQALLDDDVDVYMTPYRFLMDATMTLEFLEVTEEFEALWPHYYESVLDMTGNGDQRYGVPWIGHSMALIYNKELVNAAGVNPNEWYAYNDLLEACRQVVETTEAAGIGLVGANHHDVTWMMDQFIYTFGGSLMTTAVEGQLPTVAINSQESAKALDFYINGLGAYAQEGWENHTGVDVLEAFGTGQVAFEIQGPWAVSDVWKRGYPFEVGVLALDRIGMYSEVGPMMLSISKDSMAPEAAVEFIEFMTNKENLERIMDGEYVPKYDAYYPFRVPVRNDMHDSDFFKKYPEYLAFIEGFKRPSISTPDSTWAEIQNELYPRLLHEAITGSISIEDALEEMAK